MKPKISVLLSTNRLNKKSFPYVEKCIDGLDEIQDGTFNEEFEELTIDRLYGITHFIEPTLKSLEKQKFKDFEFILSHKYPEDLNGIVNCYNIKSKVVKEKHSIWHDLGDEYHTVANNKNTTLINSSGELIYHIDDMSYFNENLLQEVWNLYKDGKYVTGRTIRRISYNKGTEDYVNKKGYGKIEVSKNGWVGQIKPLVKELNYPTIPNNMFWTCSASVSAKELLEINGYDELYDGSLCGLDMDAGDRLSKITKYKRVASEVYLYELADSRIKNNIRDDVMMRKLWNVQHLRANSWKPKPYLIKRYERWHKNKLGELDKNWNKFMNVPLYDLERVI